MTQVFSKMRYRSEIDGLRAIAVVPVILFHAGFESFRGGFVGVDVFFVVSGYLITSVILSEMDEGKFSLVKFYERRVRRILPMLFFLMVVCVPFASMWFMPRDRGEFAQSVIAASTFYSNILFWQESGYFDTVADLKPLIHTWSLAVEEQYYILFPVFLMLTWRLGKRWMLASLGVVFLLSLGLAHWGSYNTPTAAFFLLPTRGWEILLGAFAAFYFNRYGANNLGKPLNEALGWLGLLFIAYATFVFDELTRYPSLYTVVPTLGALLIILCAQEGTIAQFVLSNRLFVGIGLISYSAYLWHQPLLAFAKYRSITEPTILFRGLLCLATFPLAYLTWRFIEQPFRQAHVASRKFVFASAASVGSGLIIFGLVMYLNEVGLNRDKTTKASANYFFDYQSNFKLEKFSYAYNRNGGLANVETIRPAKSRPRFRVILLGDSHAGQLRAMGEYYASKYDVEWSTYEFMGCPPIFGFYKVYNILQRSEPLKQLACRRQIELWEQFVVDNRESFDLVILASRWNWMFNGGNYGDSQIREDALVEKGFTFSASGDLRQLSRNNFIAGLSRTLATINKVGMKAVVFGQPPLLARDPIVCSSHDDRRAVERCMFADYESIRKRGEFVSSVLSDKAMFDQSKNMSVITEESLCNAAIKKCIATYGDILLYRDRDHLSDEGAIYVAKYWESLPHFPFRAWRGLRTWSEPVT